MRSPTWRAAGMLGVIAVSLTALTAQAAAPLTVTLGSGADGEQVAGALRIVMVLTALTLLPAIIVAMTSFTRTIIVLSILRHAFGMQDTPPNVVLLSLALALTVFTMAPAIAEINAKAYTPLMRNEATLEQATTAAVAPLREFMIRQTREKDLQVILDVSHTPVPDSIEDVQTIHLTAAFLLSELKTSFQIGFILFLPFLLIDIVVASILMSMGMLMVPPTIISLPLKILMFVLIDGWGLVVRALLGSFH